MKLYSIFTPLHKEGEYTIGGPLHIKITRDGGIVVAVADLSLAKRFCELDKQLESFPKPLEQTPDISESMEHTVFLIRDTLEYDRYLENRQTRTDSDWLNEFVATVTFDGVSWKKL